MWNKTPYILIIPESHCDPWPRNVDAPVFLDFDPILCVHEEEIPHRQSQEDQTPRESRPPPSEC